MKYRNYDDKTKRRLKWILIAYVAIVIIACFTCDAFAASDPISVVNNLSNFIFSLIRVL